MSARDRIVDFTAEYGGWLAIGLLVILIAVAIFMIERDAATCLEWGPEYELTTFVYDASLKMMVPTQVPIRDCLRREQ